MLKQIQRFKSSLFIGGSIVLFLLSFVSVLLYTLYISQDGEIFSNIPSRIYQLLKFTIYQAFLSTVLSLFVGFFLAWSLASKSYFKARSLLISLFSSSLVLPTLVVIFGLIGIFGRNGLINNISLYLFDYSFGTYIYGLSGILIAHVYLNASFASRALLHAFETIPKEKYKLAKSLNFTLFQQFKYIEYPALKSTILNISSTIFLLCFTSFAVVLLLGGLPSYNTLEVAIYEAVKLDFDINMALKLALIQLSISSVLVVFSSSFRINLQNIKTSNTLIPWKHSKGIQYLQTIIIIIFTIFFVSPLIVIVIDGLNSNFITIFKNDIFLNSFYTSMLIASISSVLTLLITISLSSIKINFTSKYRLKNIRFSKFINILISFSGNIYLALPSLVIALGFFIMAQKYEGSQYIWSLSAVIIANILISLPFALSIMNPAMQKIASRYDKLIFSLNISKKNQFIYIQYPYLKSSIGYILALAFCFSLGDLGIIALFGNEDFSTLPWYLYQLMGSYRTQDANGVALILFVLVLFVFIFIPKLFRSKLA